MKYDYVSQLVLSYCIEYIKSRPIGTTYHPRENEFLLDGRVMAKIVKYNGNLMASVEGNELKYFNNILRYILNETSVFKSLLSKENFSIKEVHKFDKLSIQFNNMGNILFEKRGRKPKYIGEKNDNTIVVDN
jgi:hypothetical protein